MRSRNIKPGFFKNADLADAGPYAQLLFAGLWCLADKRGRLKDAPRVIKAEVFPYYDVDVNRELTVLEQLSLIQRYTVKEVAVIQVSNFEVHQSPHHTERESVLPDATGCFQKKNQKKGKLKVSSPLKNGENPSDSLIPDSPIHDSQKKAAAGTAASDSASEEIELHESLPRKSWEEWIVWRRRKKHPCDAITLRKHLALLSRFDAITQTAIIDQSINANWQGLFAPKGQPARPTAVPTAKPTMRGPDGKVTPEYDAWAKANVA